MSVLFETERLVVRKATLLEDADALSAILGDPESVRHFGSGQPWTRAQVEQFVRSYPDGDPRLVATPGLVLLKPTLEVIGFGGVGYYVAEGNTADLFFILKRAQWGQGLATEVARAALAAAFAHPQVGTVFATVKPANTASVRVLEKCSLTLQKYLPEKDRLLYRVERPFRTAPGAP
jgi:RimJ/RimL family protein N-acetyltransferase